MEGWELRVGRIFWMVLRGTSGKEGMHLQVTSVSEKDERSCAKEVSVTLECAVFRSW